VVIIIIIIITELTRKRHQKWEHYTDVVAHRLELICQTSVMTDVQLSVCDRDHCRSMYFSWCCWKQCLLYERWHHVTSSSSSQGCVVFVNIGNLPSTSHRDTDLALCFSVSCVVTNITLCKLNEHSRD